MKEYKLLTLFLVLNVSFQILSDMTAGKIIDFFGYGVPVTIIYFPVVYIISDAVTEIYGYTKAKRVAQYTLFASVLVACFTQLMWAVPPAYFFENNDAYKTVFAIVPQVVVGARIAAYFGDMSNNYVLAKIKIWTKGRFLPLRTILSTVVGELVDTSIFYVIGLAGIIPTDQLLQGVIVGWISKTGVEIILTPFTCLVINWVKKIEKEDFYDNGTDFNPFN